MLDWLEIPRAETPVLVHATNVMRNPSAAQVARVARACAPRSTASASTSSCSAPGRPGSRPRSTAARRACGRSWPRPGRPAARPGRARGSRTTSASRPASPATELTRKATLQARRFDAVLSSFHRAVELADGPEGLVRVDLDDGQHVLARSVVMATGARWRELQAEGVDRFRGAGVYHAAMATDAERCRDEDVIVVGGGNSAGPGGDAPRLARAQRAHRRARQGAEVDDVALPRRPHRALAADRGDDRDRGRRGPRHRDRRVREPAQRRRQRPAGARRPRCS